MRYIHREDILCPRNWLTQSWRLRAGGGESQGCQVLSSPKSKNSRPMSQLKDSLRKIVSSSDCILFRPLVDWMRPTHAEVGHLPAPTPPSSVHLIQNALPYIPRVTFEQLGPMVNQVDTWGSPAFRLSWVSGAPVSLGVHLQMWSCVPSLPHWEGVFLHTVIG